MQFKKLIVSLPVFIALASNAQVTMNLNHSNWTGMLQSGSMPFKSKVPFNVHSDLLNNKLISDPYIGNNEQSLQWISDSTWTYETNFNVDSACYSYEKIELVLENPDTYCAVFLNNQFLGKTNNQFISWKFNCKPKLLLGRNNLKLVFEPVSKHTPAFKNQLPIESYAFHRKPAYQFGWDWGPRFITFGLHNCYLNAFNDFQLINYQQNQVFNSDKTVDVDLKFICNAKQLNKLNYKLSCLSDSNVYIQQVENTVKDSTLVLHFKIHLINPKLWWTKELGSQYLYKFQFKAYENKVVALEKNIAIGIRNIELIQEQDSNQIGNSFYFKLNGIPVFMKGANLIPPSSFMNNLPNEQYANLTEEALNMHFNMIRIWGGGTYLTDTFYEMCDQKGILIWQDFMFAGSMYPSDTLFIQTVKKEVQEQVSRLQPHPCLALFCGNNEISEAWFNWGWQKQFAINENDSIKLIQDYKWLFEKAIPEWIAAITPTIYWPSSPLLGWGRTKSYQEGDSHYWGVWWGEAPFSAYEKHTGRFVSEYGFQGMPDLNILNKYMHSNTAAIDSSALKNHQKHKKGYELIRKYMSQHYPIPKPFNAFVYTSQLLQAHGLKIAAESHRKQQPYCMGSLIWQLNDCWPVTSWSLLDFENNRKASYYQVKKSFDPFLMTYTQTQDSLLIQIIDDRKVSEKGLLQLRLLDFNGNVKLQISDSILLNGTTKSFSYSIPLNKLIQHKKDSNSVVFEALYTSATTCKQALHYFAEPKNLALIKSKIDMHYLTPHQIQLKSKTLQKNVWIYSTECNYKLNYNFIDLLPNQVYTIEMEAGSFKEYKPSLMSLNELID